MTLETLTPEQVEFYEREGYLVLENRVPMTIIEAIQAEIKRFQEEARGMTASDAVSYTHLTLPTIPLV